MAKRRRGPCSSQRIERTCVDNNRMVNGALRLITLVCGRYAVDREERMIGCF
jgi:hypothetical protein